MTWSVGVNKKLLAVYFDGRQFENMAEVLCLYQRITYQGDTLILVLNTEAVLICATHHLTWNPAGSSHILCFRDMAPKAPNKLRKKLQRKEQEILEAPHSAASKAPNGNSLCCVPKGQSSLI